MTGRKLRFMTLIDEFYSLSSRRQYAGLFPALLQYNPTLTHARVGLPRDGQSLNEHLNVFCATYK